MKLNHYSLQLFLSYDLQLLLLKHPDTRKAVKRLSKEIEYELNYLIKHKKSVGDA